MNVLGQKMEKRRFLPKISIKKNIYRETERERL